MDIVELLKIIFLAIFQGIAEFLPISSSGHLAVLGQILGIDPEANFLLAIILHLGTLAAIIVYYFRDIIAIIFKWQWQVIIRLIVATIPVGIVGVAIKLLDPESKIFNNLYLISGCFLLTAFLLFSLKKQSQSSNELKISELPFAKVLFVGFMQSVAILPGVSRSGSTIFGGLKSGLSNGESAKFSFLLGAAAIGGASILEILSLTQKTSSENFSSNSIIGLSIGFLVSGGVGYFALKILLKVLAKGKIEYFSYYLFFASILTLIVAIFIK
ncbi:MAG: undecaprenyl-diphosphate phosphatase [Lentisphaeria bacterium]|nr:undecaprenyl-diphosphate phosphatase [Lentisphaeria bacterium]